jgi:hypothetical protein
MNYWHSTNASTWTAKTLPTKKLYIQNGSGATTEVTYNQIGTIRRIGSLWYVSYKATASTDYPSVLYSLSDITNPATISALPVGVTHQLDTRDFRYSDSDGTDLIYNHNGNVTRIIPLNFANGMQPGVFQLYSDSFRTIN